MFRWSERLHTTSSRCLRSFGERGYSTVLMEQECQVQTKIRFTTVPYLKVPSVMFACTQGIYPVIFLYMLVPWSCVPPLQGMLALA